MQQSQEDSLPESAKDGLEDSSHSLLKALVMPLQLHCLSVCLEKPGQPAIRVTAELSGSMAALMRLLGWDIKHECQ